MAIVSEHLSVEELEERYVACSDASASRHFQVIWLLARGHAVSQVSATTAFGERCIEQLLTRYNALGTRRAGRFASPQRRIGDDPEVGAPGEAARSPWRTAARWRAVVEPQGRELDGGRTRLGLGCATARLGSVEGDRLVDPGAASEEPPVGDAGRSGGVQKKLADALAEKAAKHPGKTVEVFAADERRIAGRASIRKSRSGSCSRAFSLASFMIAG
jgi:hypothetical protein